MENDKPYLVALIIEGKLVSIKEKPTLVEAIDYSIKTCKEHCTISETDIKKELEIDGDFCTESGNLWIGITQKSDD